MNTTTVLKRCQQCGTVFESPPHYNKVYHNAACRRAAKHQRERDRTEKTPTTPPTFDDRFIPLWFPTKEKLDRHASIITEDEPRKIYGHLPTDWIKPDNVKITKQPIQEFDKDIWLMELVVKDEIQAFLDSLKPKQ